MEETMLAALIARNVEIAVCALIFIYVHRSYKLGYIKNHE